MTNEKLNALKLKLKDINDKCLYELECFENMKLEKEEIESESGFCDDENYNYERFDVIVMKMDEQEDKIQKLKNEYIVALVDLVELIEGRKSTHES